MELTEFLRSFLDDIDTMAPVYQAVFYLWSIVWMAGFGFGFIIATIIRFFRLATL
ncbi:hypothetical protein L8Q74_01595 [Enterobacter roggenkampii]|nr:hypothetical protein [Enterobacter roggenkampii]